VRPLFRAGLHRLSRAMRTQSVAEGTLTILSEHAGSVGANDDVLVRSSDPPPSEGFARVVAVPSVAGLSLYDEHPTLTDAHGGDRAVAGGGCGEREQEKEGSRRRRRRTMAPACARARSLARLASRQKGKRALALERARLASEGSCIRAAGMWTLHHRRRRRRRRRRHAELRAGKSGRRRANDDSNFLAFSRRRALRGRQEASTTMALS